MVSDSLSMSLGLNTVETQKNKKVFVDFTCEFNSTTYEEYSSMHRDLSMFSLGEKISRGGITLNILRAVRFCTRLGTIKTNG